MPATSTTASAEPTARASALAGWVKYVSPLEPSILDEVKATFKLTASQ